MASSPNSLVVSSSPVMPGVERDPRFKSERAQSETELSDICLQAMLSVFACVPAAVEERVLRDLEEWINQSDQTKEIARRCREACSRAVARTTRREAAQRNTAFDFGQALREDPELAPLLRADRMTHMTSVQLPAESQEEWRGFAQRKRGLASDLARIARHGPRQHSHAADAGTVTVFSRAVRGSFPEDQDRQAFAEHLDAEDLRTIHASVAWEMLVDRYLASLAEKNGPFVRTLSVYAENIRDGISEAFLGTLDSGRHPIALRIRTFRESVRHFFERQQQAREAKRELEAAMKAKQNPSADRIREAGEAYARSMSALGEAYDRLSQGPDAGLDGRVILAEFRRMVAEAAGCRLPLGTDDPIRRAVEEAEKTIRRSEAKPLDIKPAEDIRGELAAIWMETIVEAERERAGSDDAPDSPLSDLLRSLRTAQDTAVAISHVSSLRQALRADMERALRAEKPKWFIKRLEELSSRLRDFLSSANALVALSREAIAPSEAPRLMAAVSDDLCRLLGSRGRRTRSRTIGTVTEDSLREAVSAGACHIGSPASARQATGTQILETSGWGPMLDALREAHAKNMARVDAPDRVRKEPKPARAERTRRTDRNTAEAPIEAGPTLRQHRERLSLLVRAGLEALRPAERTELPAVAEFRTTLRADVLAELDTNDSALARDYRELHGLLAMRDGLLEEGGLVKQTLRKTDDPGISAESARTLERISAELCGIRSALSKRAADAGEGAIREFERRLALAADPAQDDARRTLAEFERASAQTTLVSAAAFRDTASWAFLRAQTGELKERLDRINALAADLEAFSRAQAAHRQARTQLNGLYAVISKMTKEDVQEIENTVSRLSEETARHARAMEEIGGRLGPAVFERARRMFRHAISDALAAAK